MASFNKVILAGNLTRDPELKSLPSGSSVAAFGLAVNRRYKSKDGDLREEVTYVDIESFGVQAETIAKYCSKGSSLLVEGRLRFDEWNDKTSGEKRSRLRVVLEGFTFLGSRGDNASGGGSNSQGNNYENAPARRPAQTAAATARSAPPPPPSDSLSDEDVPF